jgi:uncharacterized protein
VKFQIYKSGTEYRWRLKADNGEIIAQGESYVNKSACEAVIKLVKSTTTSTPVEDLT